MKNSYRNNPKVNLLDEGPCIHTNYTAEVEDKNKIFTCNPSESIAVAVYIMHSKRHPIIKICSCARVIRTEFMHMRRLSLK